MDLTPDVVEAEAKRWTFAQPGYRLEFLDLDDPFRSRLVIQVTTADSEGKADQVVVSHNYPMDPAHFYRWSLADRFAMMFAQWVRECVHRTVLHEADEWLQRDGVAPFDPHAQDRARHPTGTV